MCIASGVSSEISSILYQEQESNEESNEISQCDACLQERYNSCLEIYEITHVSGEQTIEYRCLDCFDNCINCESLCSPFTSYTCANCDIIVCEDCVYVKKYNVNPTPNTLWCENCSIQIL